jgi:CIC family chloride channel protein
VIAPKRSFAERLSLGEHHLFLALTVIIGVAAGLSAVLFALGIDLARHFFFGTQPSALRIVAIPAGVSVVTGLLLAKVFPDVRGSGIPQTETAFHLHGGVIPGRVPLGKFITGVLCVGSGHSMGREGPSVQIGAGLASFVGQRLRLSPARLQSLIPVAAAAALSAAFNTPVAAVIFALEEIIGDMNASLIGSTVVASVAAVIVERSILGNEPLFRVPAYHLVHPAELLAYGVLGIVGGAISLVFVKGLLAAREQFLRMPPWTVWLRPAIGGLMVGVLFLAAPQTMGVGYEYVDQALNGGMALRVMVFLAAAKLVATILSYASGNAGGIFAPSLYLGAMVGGAMGMVVQQVAPFQTAGVGAYALVGMGTLFAGIIRAPMTSVFMIFEITQDYQILVPLMVANLLSFVISRRFQPTPVYHALLDQDGVHLPGIATRTTVGKWHVRDVMMRELSFLPAGATVAEAAELAKGLGGRCCLVGSPMALAGLVTRDRLEESVQRGQGDESVAICFLEHWPHVHADHSLETAIERFSESPGLLPVVSRVNVGAVEGVVTLDSIVRLLNAPAAERHASKADPA